MKKSIGLIFVFFLVTFLHAETIKMKDGSLISGSILSQTQYTLNLATSYGNITLNQREIEQILPDKHRVVLSGGTQLIGVITDLDEFNLKLQTDDGSIVNIDMPQIVSIEAYDYDRGADAQKEFVEKTQQLQAAQMAAAQTLAHGTVQAEGGLTFDSDINQVFDSKNATVVNGTVVTPNAQTKQTSPKFLTEEEAFVKGEPSSTSYTQAQKKELLEQNSGKKRNTKTLPNENEFSKYFALQIGARPTDLKLDNSDRGNYWTADDNAIDVSGTGVAVSGKFLWRLGGSNLWAGPFLGISNIPNASFEDKDSTAQDNPTYYPDPTAKTSGRILELGGSAHYYINPKSRFAFYLVGTAGLEMLQLNYRGEVQSHSMSSNGFFAGGGIGVETWVDDLMIGLEAREIYAKRSNRLSGSGATNLVVQLQTSWKF
ncbi:MAG: hypothetical protein J5601_00435 [Elusimicrobiaceae bacterium]|nr:hypothetical protein [Elusimicrobiaceae bacterium]